MPHVGQLSLLQRGPLFERQVLAQFLSGPDRTTVPDEKARQAALAGWLASVSAQADLKETALEQGFNQRVLVEALGYKLHPAEGASAYPKPGTSVTQIQGEPDVLLGSFGGDDSQILAVLELKKPGANLDAPQAGYGNRSPVEQAFDYGRSIFGVRWVLVSDMRLIRLYSIDSMLEFELFDLRRSADDPKAAENFRRLFHLVGREALTAQGAESPTALLLRKSITRQREIKDAFYDTYYEIRRDLFFTMRESSAVLTPPPDTDELLESVQRLLDRMLFLFYCEDSPDQLIPRETVKRITEAARSLPGPKGDKVYEALKHLFREVDAGSPPQSALTLNGYNGELFKPHRVIDAIDLPDTLHDKLYTVREPDGGTRRVRGVWGLHEFDFWRELNEHLLGHIFEESLSDMADLSETETEVSLAEKLAQRKQHGIYYTDDLLSDFLVGHSLRAVLDDLTRDAEVESELDRLRRRMAALDGLRIIDFACGSGAFLVSAYQALQQEFLTLQEGLLQLGGPQDLLSYEESMTQARLLRRTLYGADLLPQAVEIAKLALWLRSARKGEKIADLGSNVVAHDSLDIAGLYAAIQGKPGSFDLVVGNPPWGGEVEEASYRAACSELGLLADPEWDSWELFLTLALHSLRDGGRIAMVLPDTIFSPEKERSRRLLLEHTRIQRLHNLGPDWFGPNVRMGTVVVEAVRGQKPMTSDFTALLLSGELRRQVIRGDVPISQAEAKLARLVPQERCDASETAEIEIFRARRDDEVMNAMTAHSFALAQVCERARGEEMAKTGLLWRCPSCLNDTVPGKKKKGGTYHSKLCPSCSYELTQANTEKRYLVVTPEERDDGEFVSFIDGDDINHRYVTIEPRKWLRRDAAGWAYKNPMIYASPKIILRQAGVGVFATLDETDSWCPQSVYLYRVNGAMAKLGYTNEFVLAALLSRTIAYYVFKRFSEVDPARAHPKLTHKRLESLPIPKIDFDDASQRRAHDQIVANVRQLLDGNAQIGGAEDKEVELLLRRLWGLTAEDGAYINGEFAGLPLGQAIKELFPEGAPGAAVYQHAA